MVAISKRRYVLLALWVIGASALGIFLIRYFSPPVSKEALALDALTRQCGSQEISSEDEKKLSAIWVVNSKDLSEAARRAIARTMQALPARILSVLRDPPTGGGANTPIKIAIDQGKWPYLCAESELASGRVATTCLKNISGIGRVLVIGRASIVSSDGRQKQLSDEELVDQTLMPAIFWLTFERLANLRDEKPILAETETSKSNIFSQIKYYIAGGYKFSPEEESFYYRQFGMAGTESPAFVNRTVALTASNLYCDSESFDRLQKRQPEAMRRFMSAMGCGLGKAWHMSEEDFSKLCPNLASSK